MEIKNLVSHSPQQNPLTIITSKSAEDFLSQPSPRTKSMHKGVQRRQSTNNEFNKVLSTSKTNRAQQSTAPVTNLAPNNKPYRVGTRKEEIQASPNIHKTKILMKSEDDHLAMPEDTILAPAGLGILFDLTTIPVANRACPFGGRMQRPQGRNVAHQPHVIVQHHPIGHPRSGQTKC